MARTPKNHEAAAELGRRLTELSNQHGHPNPKDIELWIYREFGVRVSDESIRKAHRGEADPAGSSPELLAGMAHYYGVEPIELTDAVRARFLSLAQLAGFAPKFTVSTLDLGRCRCTVQSIDSWQPTLWESAPETGRAPIDFGMHAAAA